MFMNQYCVEETSVEVCMLPPTLPPELQTPCSDPLAAGLTGDSYSEQQLVVILVMCFLLFVW